MCSLVLQALLATVTQLKVMQIRCYGSVSRCKHEQVFRLCKNLWEKGDFGKSKGGIDRV